MHQEYSRARADTELITLFDWQSDVERLERHVAAAEADGMPDPWALAEAECSLDLIDNELATLGLFDPRRPDIAETIRRNTEWRERIARIVAELRQLEAQADASTDNALTYRTGAARD